MPDIFIASFATNKYYSIFTNGFQVKFIHLHAEVFYCVVTEKLKRSYSESNGSENFVSLLHDVDKNIWGGVKSTSSKTVMG